MTTVATRWLAYFPSPPRGVWHLGPLPIRAYAFFIIIGIVVGLMIGDRRFAARGGERSVVYDIALWMVPFGLIGGRLYHLATDWPTYFGPGGAGIGAALRIWDGGLGIWGAVALGVVGAWIGCRRRGIPLPAFLDAVAPGLVIGQAIGRLGNYFNQELYGRETTVPWGLEIFYRRDPAGFVDVHSLDGVSTGQVAAVVQPTFLYELIWNLLVFAALIYLDRRFTIGHGRLFGLYVALYCVGRFCVELLRDDTATHIAGIRVNSFTSTFVFIGAVVYVILATKGREDPSVVRGRVEVADEESEPEPAEVAASTLTAAASEATVAGPASSGKDDEPAASAETVQAAEVAEAETMQAEIAVPEGADAEVDEPETVQAEIAVPGGADADVDEPETVQAEVSEAEVDEAEGEEPEVAEAEVEEAEVEEVEADEPEVAEGEVAEAEEPETDVEAEEPEVAEAEVEEAEAEEAEADEPEVAEAEEPETDVEAVEPEVAEAEVEEVEADEPEVAEGEVAEAEEPETDAEAKEPEVAEVEAEVEEAEADEPVDAEAQVEEADAEAEAEAEEPETDAGAEEPEVDEPEVAEPEVAEPEAAEADAEVESVEQSAAEAGEEATEDATPVVEDAEAEPAEDAAKAEPADDDDESTASPVPSAGSTRLGWRARLRNRRQRSGR